ncbi:thioredoxin fold domain-containing protein [Flammeovirga sp. MY04]|uniref:thioredoxin fold domain-containing protein n=1 Tax=Flammeovirga sp. MY04 TaxID=1191459 RepID=UPI0013050BEF|nr:thioredoxin fold domain-containing protein [Flammeovirga sp. MY04]ANQ49406.2 thioredoxin fold domain-containing protein [Flammeovirga sp. MY04]
MNKQIILTMLLLFQYSIMAYAQNTIHFETKEWDEILQLSENEGKLIYFGITTKWSQPCQNFVENVYKDKKVSEYFNEEFINVNRDLEDQLSKEFVSRYSIRSFPAHLFFNEKGQLIHLMKGAMPPNVFLSRCKKVEDPSYQYYTIKNKIRSEEEVTFEEYLNYCSSTFELGVKDEKACEEFIKLLDEDKLADPKVMDVVCHTLYHSNVRDQAFTFFVEHHDKLLSHIQTKNLENIYTQLVKNTLSKNLEEKNPVVFEKEMYVLKQYLPNHFSVKAAFIYEPKFYLSIGDHQKAFYRIKDNFEAAKKIKDHKVMSHCNDWAWMIYTTSENPSYLNNALSWVEYGISEDHNTLDMMDTQAHLYYKLGMFEKAEKVAIEVKNAYDKKGVDSKKMTDLLQQIKLN